MPNYPPSFYEVTATPAPRRPALAGSRRADVCIVGGGFTGLSAALHLAEAGAEVVLLEAGRIASGASGRNGGQLHSGQRQDVLWLEQRFGFERARAMWDMAQSAKALVRDLVERFAIDCDLRTGVIDALHKPAYVDEAAELVEALHTRYGYDQIDLLGRDEIVEALGSAHYLGGTRDRGGGHLNPLALARGLAEAAEAAGAAIHENSAAIELRRDGKPVVLTADGEIRADHVIVATNGRSGPFESDTSRRVLGLNNFVVALKPLGSLGEHILPGGECASDSYFVVCYWRKTADGHLIFGGGESSTRHVPADIASFVRPHLARVYPALRHAEVAHAWGGVVSITGPRLPFVRAIRPDVWAAGGFSGQGVGLAPYTGKLLAEAALGRTEGLQPFLDLPIPPIPRSDWFRQALVTLAIWQGRLKDRL
ncbi:gamma-glutamylputrescine oxidase [Faunimonas pinastri]|uniref:Gamma-glutamylputrescine oxidase n=1 Tax=Faunimonas pinastri TaxID=1855383 RepID=A0A1H9M2H1_9HYPH|nr:FAD-binding oxidoreductase [Faunimonas pinastri]SER17890.1 gamma-glutamylputrescine oxidase [Faunimonas pinastri]